MAKIQRYDGDLKAFSSEAEEDERTVFGSETQSDSLSDQLTTQFLRGWGIVGPNDFPTKQDFNALGYTLSQLLSYLHQAGVAEWNSGQEYHTDSIASTSSGIWQSLTDDNVGNDPESDDGTNWGALGSPGRITRSRYQSFPVTKWAANSGISPAQKPGSEYDPTSNRTYLAWAGPGWEPHIAYYDHSGQYFSESVRIGPYPIADDDDHGKPTLVIDNSGYIYVFYGSHNSSQYQAKSDDPRDISSWTITELTSIPEMTYPSPCVHSSTGDLYFLFRAGGDGHGSTYPAHEFAGLARSTDGGDTWSDVGPVIDTTGFPGSASDAYVIGELEEYNDRLYMTWVVADGSEHDDVRKNVYVAYYDTDDGNMYALDGTNMGSTVEESDHSTCEVQSADYTNYPHLAISSTGEVYCCWTQLLSSGDQVGIFAARWNGSSWDVQDTGITCSIIFNMAQLRIDEDTNIVELFAVYNDDVVPDPTVIPGVDQGESLLAKGGDIVVYQSDVGNLNFSHQQTVARKEDSTALGYRNPSVPRNSDSGLKLFYATSSLSNTEYTCPIYAATDSQRDPLRVTDMLTRLPQPRVEFHNSGSNHEVYDSDTDDGGTVPTDYREVDCSAVLPANATHAIIRYIVHVGVVSSGDEDNYSISARQKGSPDSDHITFNAGYYEADSPQTHTAQLETPISYDKKLEIRMNNGDAVNQIRLRVVGWRLW